MKASYKIDPSHSSAHFSVRHMMISNVRGAFSNVQGTMVFDPENPSDASIEAVIDATTISTQDVQRDGHLKGADFLDTEKYPTITFRSKTVTPGGPGDSKVTGDLTIRGVTKEVLLDVEGPTPEGKDPYGNTRVGASATTKIKRSDFGLTWSATLETGGVLIGDDLKIEIDVSLIKA